MSQTTEMRARLIALRNRFKGEELDDEIGNVATDAEAEIEQLAAKVQVLHDDYGILVKAMKLKGQDDVFRGVIVELYDVLGIPLEVPVAGVVEAAWELSQNAARAAKLEVDLAAARLGNAIRMAAILGHGVMRVRAAIGAELDGLPHVRDPDSPCRHFEPGVPKGRMCDCDGDGHYLCQECEHLNVTMLTDGDEGSND